MVKDEKHKCRNGADWVNDAEIMPVSCYGMFVCAVRTFVRTVRISIRRLRISVRTARTEPSTGKEQVCSLSYTAFLLEPEMFFT